MNPFKAGISDIALETISLIFVIILLIYYRAEIGSSGALPATVFITSICIVRIINSDISAYEYFRLPILFVLLDICDIVFIYYLNAISIWKLSTIAVLMIMFASIFLYLLHCNDLRKNTVLCKGKIFLLRSSMLTVLILLVYAFANIHYGNYPAGLVVLLICSFCIPTFTYVIMPRRQKGVSDEIYVQSRNTFLMISAQAVASIGFIILLTDGYFYPPMNQAIVGLVFIATAFICNKIAWYNPKNIPVSCES